MKKLQKTKRTNTIELSRPKCLCLCHPEDDDTVYQSYDLFRYE
ncbi:hypothetical protein PV797_04345 [Clostridiaceae bacterium M8S5]|nr:hypothetical protein PV797_04345 [Clostridiaceae bacterium M8S5]